MGADGNIKTVQSMYEAFGRADVPAILDALTEDVDWATDTSSTVAPWYGVRHGKQETASFFRDYGSNMEVQEFTPIDFAANDEAVMTIVRSRATVRKTGKTIEMNLHHYFRFRDGQVCYHRATEDTARIEAALR